MVRMDAPRQARAAGTDTNTENVGCRRFFSRSSRGSREEDQGRIPVDSDYDTLWESVRGKMPSLPRMPIPRALRPHLPRTEVDRAEADSDFHPTMSSGVVAGVSALMVSAASQLPDLIPFRSYDAHEGEPVWDIGSDRGEIVAASDGNPLAVREVGPVDAELTVVFVHGFTLSMDSFHFQSTGLKEKYGSDIRMVFYDQRGHGLSGRADSRSYTITQLAEDLHNVIGSVARTGPIVLAGHSMGGMTVLKFAEMYPDLVRERVVGVGLLAAAADKLPEAGLPAILDNPLITSVAWSAEKTPGVFHSGRRALGMVIEPLIKAGAFGNPTMVGKTIVEFTNNLIGSADVEVMAGFVDALVSLDAKGAYSNLADVSVSIVCGDADLMTPVNRSIEMSRGMPGARFVVVPGCGHMVQLEAIDITNDELAYLIDGAFESIGIERERVSSVWTRTENGDDIVHDVRRTER